MANWGYIAGASGTETLTGSKRVFSVTAFFETAGTVTIDGGDTINIPADGSLYLNPKGSLIDPEIIFTGSASYLIEYVG